jgi:hypothetical protein
MTTAEILLQDYDAEIAGTRRVLERIPEDLPDFKCHDKSMPLGRLAMHVATLPMFGLKLTLYQAIAYFLQWLIVGAAVGLIYRP